MFLQYTFPRQRLFRSRLFAASLGAAIVGVATSHVLFPTEAGVISVFLTSFSLLHIVNNLFELNRREIWEEIASPYKANRMLGLALLAVFLGILSGYGLFAAVLNPDAARALLSEQLGDFQDIKRGFGLAQIHFGSFSEILRHNFSVLLVVLLFSLLFRAGGLLLIVAWNASSWGSVFGFIARTVLSGLGLRDGLLPLLASYLGFSLHLVLESAGYVLCAMAGLFMSKAFTKYFFDFKRFVRVTRASVLIFAFALFLIVLSAFFESTLSARIAVFFSR